MSLSSAYRIAVFDCFEALQKALNLLKKAVCEEDAILPGWFQAPQQLFFIEANSSREKAMAFIQQLEYLNGQEPREILIGPGVFAASDKSLKSIREVNECKNRFKAAILALKKANISLSHPELNDYFEKTLSQRSPQVVHVLRKMGLARLHLKQCYRQIPCLIRRPLKISWTWAHTKAITRLSVREAEQLLHQKGKTKSMAYELSKLYTLDVQEPLAIVQQLAPHLRVNLVFPDGQGIRRSMMKGTVPLFYPMEDVRLPGLQLPPKKEARSEEKTIRSDVQLEPQPFLASVPIYGFVAFFENRHNF